MRTGTSIRRRQNVNSYVDVDVYGALLSTLKRLFFSRRINVVNQTFKNKRHFDELIYVFTTCKLRLLYVYLNKYSLDGPNRDVVKRLFNEYSTYT